MGLFHIAAIKRWIEHKITRNKSNDYFETLQYWQDLFVITC